MITSSSELKAWQRCKRKWWLRYYRNMSSPEGDNSPANVGNMVHKCLEEFYATGAQTPLLALLEPMYDKMLKDYPEFESKLERDRDLAVQMVTKYMEWLGETYYDNDLEFYAAEQSVTAKLGNSGHTLTGKIDARARRKSTGGKVNMDHKTVKGLDMLVKTAQIDTQFLTYNLLEYLDSKDKEEDRADGLILNMLRRVNSDNPLSKPPYFARYEVQHNQNELRSHWLHVVALCHEMEKAWEALEHGGDHHLLVPPSPDKNCAWDCNFRGVCPMFDDGSNAEGFLAMNYTVGKQYEHQEVREHSDTAIDRVTPALPANGTAKIGENLDGDNRPSTEIDPGF